MRQAEIMICLRRCGNTFGTLQQLLFIDGMILMLHMMHYVLIVQEYLCRTCSPTASMKIGLEHFKDPLSLETGQKLIRIASG